MSEKEQDIESICNEIIFEINYNYKIDNDKINNDEEVRYEYDEENEEVEIEEIYEDYTYFNKETELYFCTNMKMLIDKDPAKEIYEPLNYFCQNFKKLSKGKADNLASDLCNELKTKGISFEARSSNYYDTIRREIEIVISDTTQYVQLKKISESYKNRVNTLVESLKNESERSSLINKVRHIKEEQKQCKEKEPEKKFNKGKKDCIIF